jgi:hypothetical protein
LPSLASSYSQSALLNSADDAVFWELQHRADDLVRQGRYEAAAPVVRAALAEATASSRVGIQMAVALHDAGYLYAKPGRCGEARTALLRSMGVWKALGATRMDGVIATGSTLASVHLDSSIRSNSGRWSLPFAPLMPLSS